MKTDNVFFVGFNGKETRILHSKCGCPIIQKEKTVDAIDLSCPVCKMESMCFFKHAWAQVLAKLKKLPINGKLVVQKCYSAGEIILSAKEAIVLERRDIK